MTAPSTLARTVVPASTRSTVISVSASYLLPAPIVRRSWILVRQIVAGTTPDAHLVPTIKILRAAAAGVTREGSANRMLTSAKYRRPVGMVPPVRTQMGRTIASVQRVMRDGIVPSILTTVLRVRLLCSI